MVAAVPSFIRAGTLFPPCSAPHKDKDGHMILYEYIFMALASPSPELILNRLVRICNPNPVSSGVVGREKNGICSTSGSSSGSSSASASSVGKMNRGCGGGGGANGNVRSQVATSKMNTNTNTNNQKNINHENTPTDIANTMTANYNITGMNDDKATKAVILLPDLIIYWAISMDYNHAYERGGIQKVIHTTTTKTTTKNTTSNKQQQQQNDEVDDTTSTTNDTATESTNTSTVPKTTTVTKQAS